jgi:integrase
MSCKIYVSKKGVLAYRLHWNKQSSWEGTNLRDTPQNRKRVEADADLMSREMKAGRFDYGRWFPAGNKAPKTDAPRQSWTVREYYGKWILQQRPPLVRKTNERAYKQHFSRYILPRFGEVSLTETALTTRALMDFQNYLLHNVPRLKKGTQPGLSVKTARNIMDGSFRAMVRDAREIDRLITTDPFMAIQWPKAKPVKRDPFTKEERDKILEYFRENQPFYYPFILTMFWTGMRPSECTALRVGDIDLKNGFIAVDKSRTLGEENATKTVGSTRTVKLFPQVAAILRRAKELRVTEDDYFFKNRKRRPIDADQWRKDYWYAALRAKYIRERDFYCTRHTFISLALTAGENIKAIAEQCGTSVQMIE